jgi:hypothetical protein
VDNERLDARFAGLFDFLLGLELLDLPTLAFDLSLLGRQLRLGLRLLCILILQVVADGEAASGPDGAADRGAGAGRANRGADYGAGTGTYQSSNAGTFFTSSQRLTRASYRSDQHQDGNNRDNGFSNQRTHLSSPFASKAIS